MNAVLTHLSLHQETYIDWLFYALIIFGQNYQAFIAPLTNEQVAQMSLHDWARVINNVATATAVALHAYFRSKQVRVSEVRS